MKNTILKRKQLRRVVCTLCCFLFSVVSFSQVKSSIDTTNIKIGEQITYKIEVDSDSTNLVVFPEGQTFMPLEVIDSYDIDTTKLDAKINLIKKYGLTQFDSGAYTIPRQKIVIGDKTFFTDSLRVTVNNIIVDTTKQGLYGIKPIIQVEKGKSNWFRNLLIVLIAIGIIAFLIYWFVWRKKPLTEEEKIALLPPYDRAKLALKQLDESNYLEQDEFKAYYSELTLAIRKYLDEKVYDHALESTTDELISRLKLLKDGNQIDLSQETIKNLESIFKRADLVKFAKSVPDKELAKLDRNTIDVEIDHVKEVLPEPSEEEKLLNQQYKEAQERKRKRRKMVITILIIIGLLAATFVGFGIKYGFKYVTDKLLSNDSLELLEGEWVNSAYGVPPITISTPQVLKRIEVDSLNIVAGPVNFTEFKYGDVLDDLSISLTTAIIKDHKADEPIDLAQVSEKAIEELEKSGIENIFVKTDKFVTPNSAEGLKTFGSASFPYPNSDKFVDGEYVLLHFTAENIIQQIAITYHSGDEYAEEIVARILNSVELKPAAE
nr:BatD family protein [Hanstruepera neustonica]